MVFCAKLDVTVNAGVFSCFIRYMHYSSAANVFRQPPIDTCFYSISLLAFGVVAKAWYIRSSKVSNAYS